jgi:hypothetical protein
MRVTSAQAPLGTVRTHGSTPNPEVIANVHCFALNSNATYNVGSLTLRNSERVVAVITASFSFEHW